MRDLFLSALLLLLPLSALPDEFRAPSAAQTAAGGFLHEEHPFDLGARLEERRLKGKAPALAAAVIKGTNLAAVGVAGFRKQGDPTRATLNDKFHIGSCTKSMTATLAGLLVERGKISFDTMVPQTFPEWEKKMDPQYAKVSLRLLLGHRSGITSTQDEELWEKAWRNLNGTPTTQRLDYLEGIVAKPLEWPPDTKYSYCNSGYALAGAMLEKTSAQSWEEMMREMVFRPLGMATAGFGVPSAPGQVDQPWGHVMKDGKIQVPDPHDNPVAIAPAGLVHCSIGDLAKYASFHLRGARGEGALLSPAMFKTLHTPLPGQDYAMGWIAANRPWADGIALTHTGSNTMFYTVIWIAPKKDFAVVVAANIGGEAGFEACDGAAADLIKVWLTGSESSSP